MSAVTDRGKRILHTLRAEGPLDPAKLAKLLGEEMRTIRYELQEMRRAGLVYWTFQPSRVDWMLTNKGYDATRIADQLKLKVGGMS